MQFSRDKTGFPLVIVPSLGLEVQLLPVAKIQFERYLAEPGPPGDAWYESLLHLNPRASWRSFDPAHRERLFLTGILPEEALAFARWLSLPSPASGRGAGGEGGFPFTLPTVDQWRALWQLWSRTPATVWAAASGLGPPAQSILQQLQSQLTPDSLLDLSLMPDGLIEWALGPRGYCGLGRPRGAFYGNLFDPLSDEVLPVRPDDRAFFRGFRLVRAMRRSGR